MNVQPLEVVVRRAEGTGFAVRRLDRGQTLLQQRPRPLAANLSKVDDAWVLTTPDRRVYLRLGPEDHAIWQLIDGRNTVGDIATSYFLTYGALHVGRVTGFIQMLRKAGLVEVETADFLRRRFPDVGWLDRQWRWDGIQGVATAIWERVRPIASPWNAPLLAVMVLLGGAAAVADPRPLPALTGGALSWVALSLMVHLVAHELAHAVTVVAHGRRVRDLTVSFRGVSVDSTDMFLGTRTAHAWAAAAGPLSNLVLASLAASLAVAAPGEAHGPLSLFWATGMGIVALSGWPFFLDNDGAHALADILRTPNLRRDSWAAVKSGRFRYAHAVYVSGCAATICLAPLLIFLAG